MSIWRHSVRWRANRSCRGEPSSGYPCADCRCAAPVTDTISACCRSLTGRSPDVSRNGADRLPRRLRRVVAAPGSAGSPPAPGVGGVFSRRPDQHPEPRRGVGTIRPRRTRLRAPGDGASRRLRPRHHDELPGRAHVPAVSRGVDEPADAHGHDAAASVSTITQPEDGFDRGLRRVYLGVERAIAARGLQAGSDGYPGAESLPGDHDDAVGRTSDRSEHPRRPAVTRSIRAPARRGCHRGGGVRRLHVLQCHRPANRVRRAYPD